jgi:DNA repair protein RAD50
LTSWLTTLTSAKRHTDLLESRKALIRDLAEKHNIPGYDHELSDREMAEFEEKLEEATVAQQRKIEKIKVRLLFPFSHLFLLFRK